ncbi:MAG: hypothetical protein BAJALOKI1v1_270030 [Promethearchaeota archaeon]|nr:MAG: hypothetical protein BAJALOKI1v1_270030 [Candidatus Lokiarchaeota archaeon]
MVFGYLLGSIMERKTIFLLILLVLVLNINVYDSLNINIKNLQMGDLIFHESKTEQFVSGKYDHVQIYIGNGLVIEAQPPDVHYEIFSGGSVYRVRTSKQIRFCSAILAQTKIGFPYDYNITGKQINGNSYYCSELVWSLYLMVGGPDLDNEPIWNEKYAFAYGVLPMECVDDEDTYFIGYF